MKLACAVCKTAHLLLRIFRSGATALPGKLALRICPNLPELLAKDIQCIAVTGTNGKTTSAHMLEKALQNAGFPVFSNRSGANLREGICTTLVMNTNKLCKPKYDWAVLECDEAAAATVLGELKPKALLVTNLFRDQSDRYGDVKNVMERIVSGLRKSPETVLVLNADCPLVSALAERSGNKAVYFGMEGVCGRSPDRSEENDCVFCHTPLSYTSVSYANLGDWRCPNCGRKRKMPSVLVSGVSDDTAVLQIEGKKCICKPASPGLYNILNAAGVIAAARSVGVPLDAATGACEDFDKGFGRMEEFPLGKAGAVMILVKNAAAVGQTLRYIRSQSGDKTLVFIQNAHAGDGKSLDWLDDADYESLKRLRGLKRVIASGDCAKEINTRLRKAGVESDVIQNYGELLSELSDEDSRIYLLPSYTAMLALRRKLIKITGGREFWK